MSRADRPVLVAIALAVMALASCMRIYPDPELPDVIVEWYTAFTCSDSAERVVVALSSLDPAEEIGRAEAPCEDGSVRFSDVARVRYHLEAHLEGATGAERGSYDADLDLRDGLSERVSAFFNRPSSELRVAWTFDMGASCASLRVTDLQLDVAMPGGERVLSWIASCEAAAFRDILPIPGTFTTTARALSSGRVVAISPSSPPLTVVSGALADFGTLTLSPCGAACPLR